MDRNSHEQDVLGYEAPSFEEVQVTGGLAETAPAVTGPISPSY
jgi:hypothetical protein